MSATPPDDNTLAFAAQGGDLDAFETLVRAHTPAVYAHAMRFFGDSAVADDVAQEVWMKVYRALETFDGRARFSTWLYRIVRNTCLDEVRRGKRRPVLVESITPPPTTDGFADETVLSASLECALQQLPQEDRDALSAVSVFGLSYAEAAAVFGVPVGTVKSRVFRARRLLARTLGIARGGA
jgi:RNA polymerase sigma-70 factor (ECF subfamily)